MYVTLLRFENIFYNSNCSSEDIFCFKISRKFISISDSNNCVTLSLHYAPFICTVHLLSIVEVEFSLFIFNEPGLTWPVFSLYRDVPVSLSFIKNSKRVITFNLLAFSNGRLHHWTYKTSLATKKWLILFFPCILNLCVPVLLFPDDTSSKMDILIYKSLNKVFQPLQILYSK